MTTEKQLHRLRESISSVAGTLELFLEAHIQPSVDECETLQSQLYQLQEQLAVYKYGKTHKELAPFFNLHSKVSEKEMPISSEPVIKPETPEIKTEKVEPITQTKIVEPIIEIPQVKEEQASPVITTSSAKKLEVNLNDKFRFINELFKQNQLEYTIAIEQINTIDSWVEANQYLNSLKNIYGWNEENETVKRIFLLAKGRFN
jgi:hypothetical protein